MEIGVMHSSLFPRRLMRHGQGFWGMQYIALKLEQARRKVRMLTDEQNGLTLFLRL